MDSALNEAAALDRELLMFDPSRPMAPISVQLIATAAVLILTSGIFRAILKFFPSFARDISLDKEKELSAMRRKGITPTNLAIADLVSGSLYSPLSEELVFRFLLLKVYFTRTLNLNFHVANILQAALFGVLHLTNTIYSEQELVYSAAQSLSSTITGLVSGYAYYYTNSIVPSLLAHILNNVNASISQVSVYSNLSNLSNL